MKDAPLSGLELNIKCGLDLIFLSSSPQLRNPISKSFVGDCVIVRVKEDKHAKSK
jgi:hypothetical protein